MALTLFVGDYAYSSWSLRGWLLLEAFGIDFQLDYAKLGTPEFAEMCGRMAPSVLVPAVRLPVDSHESVIVWDSLAIAETLAERFPDKGYWPGDFAARARARALVAEMHTGFGALRSECPMNMRRAYADFAVSDAVQRDLARLRSLWALARSDHDGPYLFGAFSAADAFFAPVASRIATYDLPMDGADAAYVETLLAHPALRRWRALGLADAHIQPHYEFDLPARPNPHDPDVTGEVTPGARAENSNCPYSGRPVDPDSVITVGSRVIGYCNPGCAAKSAADPMAWPQTAALLGGQPG